MMTSSTILKFTGLKAETVLRSEMSWKDTVLTVRLAGDAEAKPHPMQQSVDGDYIGPATYHASDNSIYFYSQKGIFKGRLTDSLSDMKNWVRVAKPALHWKSGQIDAVGSPMNVLKLAFAPNGRLYFLSQNDGIGYVDDGKVIMLE